MAVPVRAMLIALCVGCAPEALGSSAGHVALRGQDSPRISIDELSPFERPDGTSEETFTALEADAKDMGTSARRRLLAAGRASVPALVNAMLGFDYGTKKGARRGRDCHAILLELTDLAELPWVVSTRPEDVQANLRTLEFWHRAWTRCIDDPKEWWRLLKISDGPLLDTSTTLGFPDEVLHELLLFQEAQQQLRAAYASSVAPLERSLEERRTAIERAAREELIASLPDEWERSEGGEDAAPLLAPPLIRRQLEEGVELPWPLGMRASLTDSLRTSARDSRKNQRTLKVPGLREEVEVSVVTHGDSQYALVPLHASWSEARRICAENGGHLACIEDLEELEAVVACLPEGTDSHVEVTELSNANKLFWVGATDSPSEAEWRWLDGTQVDRSLWIHPARPSSKNTAQPNNHFGTQHAAGLILHEEGLDLEPRPEPRWGLMDWVGGFSARFVCEWGVEQQLGPWDARTLERMGPWLRAYFASCAAGAEQEERARVNLEKQAKRARATFEKARKAERDALLRSMRTALAQRGDLWDVAQAHLVQRMVWLVEQDRCFPGLPELGHPGPPADAVAFLGRHYALVERAATRADAARTCRAMGGELAALSGGNELSNLLAGSVTPDQLLRADPELAFLATLLREADVERAWLGYQYRSTYLDATGDTSRRWRHTRGSTPLETEWLLNELLRGGYYLGGSFASGHSSGAVLEALDPRAGQWVTRYEPEPGQTEFALPFGPIPAQMVKLWVDGEASDAFQLGHLDGGTSEFVALWVDGDKFGATCPGHLRWTGDPLTGEEEVVIYASPITTSASHVRLPYLCTWDS